MGGNWVTWIVIYGIWRIHINVGRGIFRVLNVIHHLIVSFVKSWVGVEWGRVRIARWILIMQIGIDIGIRI
jgi:hypothetical protein